MTKYSQDQLEHISTEQVMSWKKKTAKITLVTGETIEGTINNIEISAPVRNGISMYTQPAYPNETDLLWTALILEQRIGIDKIDTVEIN